MSGSVPPRNQNTDGAPIRLRTIQSPRSPSSAWFPAHVEQESGAKCITYALGGLRIIPDKRITVQSRDLRFLRRARCRGFSIDDPFDCSERAFTDSLVKGTHVSLII